MINYKTYSYEDNEHLFGPGKRLLLFCQGCSIHCPGCINQHLWKFGIGNNISTDEIIELCKDVEGITLHGGEPLDQSDELLDVVIKLKNIGKTVILFTGYKYKELKSKPQKKVWKLSDLVISGRFVISKRNINLQFRGSTNQRVYSHKGPYKNYHIRDGKTVAIFKLNENGITTRGFRDNELNILFENILKRKEV